MLTIGYCEGVSYFLKTESVSLWWWTVNFVLFLLFARISVGGWVSRFKSWNFQEKVRSFTEVTFDIDLTRMASGGSIDKSRSESDAAFMSNTSVLGTSEHLEQMRLQVFLPVSLIIIKKSEIDHRFLVVNLLFSLTK